MAKTRYVRDYTTVDSQLYYKGLRGFTLTAGVRDLFNRVPPYANHAGTANNFIGGYDLGYGDPFGRFAYLSVAYTLH